MGRQEGAPEPPSSGQAPVKLRSLQDSGFPGWAPSHNLGVPGESGGLSQNRFPWRNGWASFNLSGQSGKWGAMCPPKGDHGLSDHHRTQPRPWTESPFTSAEWGQLLLSCRQSQTSSIGFWAVLGRAGTWHKCPGAPRRNQLQQEGLLFCGDQLLLRTSVLGSWRTLAGRLAYTWWY